VGRPGRQIVAAGTLNADGTTIAPRAVQTSDKAWSVIAPASTASSLDVPATAAGAWLVITSEGVQPGSDYKVGGNGMSISRTYRDLGGNEIDPSQGQLKLGDLVFVEIEVGNTSGAYMQNIAVVDRLPAGFEVENPRLGRATRADWMKDEEAWPTEFMNLRDDRLEAFGALGPHTKRKIIYTVRVVTSGKFAIPPVEAEAMYDPTLWARGKGGTAVIGGPWTGKLL
jgi:uncharacterized repeat protein (TIGR01451 family)